MYNLPSRLLSMLLSASHMDFPPFHTSISSSSSYAASFYYYYYYYYYFFFFFFFFLLPFYSEAACEPHGTSLSGTLRPAPTISISIIINITSRLLPVLSSLYATGPCYREGAMPREQMPCHVSRGHLARLRLQLQLQLQLQHQLQLQL
jgi:hypothetical protein